jgi:RNA polymerase sigma-70 factor (ECF subfamily)
VEPDSTIRDVCRADAGRAATVTIEQYGPEVYGFLLKLLRSDQDASDVFSMFSEDLWRGLARFEWRCSLRTWLYRLARNAATRWGLDRDRYRARAVPLSELSEVMTRVVTRSPSFAESQARDRLQELRASLLPDDQALLTLRLDRKLAWDDIARVLGDPGDAEPDATELRRTAARLRKRFQLLKDELRARARATDLA